MLLRKTDLLSVLTSLSLPVIRHSRMLQVAGGSFLSLPTCLGYSISESLKGNRFKSCDNKLNHALVERLNETNEPCATGIVGGTK